MIWWYVAAYLAGAATVIVMLEIADKLTDDKELLVYLKRKIEKRLSDA